MPTTTRRYQWIGISLAEVQLNFGASALLPVLTYMPFVDVTYDSSVDSAAVDGLMAAHGFSFASAAPNGSPGLTIVAGSNEQDISLFTPTNYAFGLGLSFRTTSQIQIAPGRARSSDDTFTLVLSAAIVVDISTVGTNGLDAGAVAANTWYYAFVIGDSTGANPTAGLLSTSASAPALPPGYNEFRRVGVVRADATSNLINFIQLGAGMHRAYQYLSALSTRQLLVSGAAVVKTSVDASSLVPPTSQFGRFEVTANLADASLFAGALGGVIRQVVSAAQLDDVLPTDTAQAIAYQNSGVGGATNIWCTGFDEAV